MLFLLLQWLHHLHLLLHLDKQIDFLHHQRYLVVDLLEVYYLTLQIDYQDFYDFLHHRNLQMILHHYHHRHHLRLK
jgi:hypothetical protein